MALVKKVDERANPLLLEIFSVLTKSEIDLFYRIITNISTVAGVPMSPARENEPHLRAEIRRLTRALTLLKSKVFSSDLNPTEWHIVSELEKYSAKGMTVSAVSIILNLSAATVSASYQSLYRREYLDVSLDALDKRKRRYFLTRRGVSALSEANTLGAKIIEAGLRKYPANMRRSFLHILRELVG